MDSCFDRHSRAKPREQERFTAYYMPTNNLKLTLDIYNILR